MIKVWVAASMFRSPGYVNVMVPLKATEKQRMQLIFEAIHRCRNEKISKLANAVRELRGLYRPGSQFTKHKWVRTPKPDCLARVAVWLERLNLPVDETLHQIRSFKSYKEFNAWIRTL